MKRTWMVVLSVVLAAALFGSGVWCGKDWAGLEEVTEQLDGWNELGSAMVRATDYEEMDYTDTVRVSGAWPDGVVLISDERGSAFVRPRKVHRTNGSVSVWVRADGKHEVRIAESGTMKGVMLVFYRRFVLEDGRWE